jgi:S-formylglutathione hydrolase FrmB
MGYSMGGYGALILPAKNPGIFKISVPLSMSFRTDQQYVAEPQGVFNSQWAPVFGGNGTSGAARLTDYFKQNSPFYFFDKADLSEFTGFKLLFDCGDDEESLSITSGALHNLLRDRNLPHEYRMGNGAHTWGYWYKAIPEALRFISKGFQGAAYPSEPAAVSTGTSITEEQYVVENLASSSIQLGIFKPAAYATSTDKYPVIFYINDSEESLRRSNAIKMMSFLNNNMQAGKIPQSVIVEIPYGTSGIAAATMAGIVEQIKTNHRVVTGKESRILIGSGRGGSNAWALMPDCKQLIKSCFLFDATLPDNATAEPGAFYYLDVTDKTSGYKGNHSLYADLRLKGVDHEYRVRQGTPSFQSFVNGVDASWYYLSRQLKNQ